MGNENSVPDLSAEQKAELQKKREVATAWLATKDANQKQRAAEAETGTEGEDKRTVTNAVRREEQRETPGRVPVQQASPLENATRQTLANEAPVAAADAVQMEATAKETALSAPKKDVTKTSEVRHAAPPSKSRPVTLQGTGREEGELSSDDEPLFTRKGRMPKSSGASYRRTSPTRADSKEPVRCAAQSTILSPTRKASKNVAHTGGSEKMAVEAKACKTGNGNNDNGNNEKNADQRRPSTTSLPASLPKRPFNAIAGQRDMSMISGQKRQKQTSSTSASASTSPQPQSPVTMTDLTPPEWYTKMVPEKTRIKDSANADILLQRIKSQIADAKAKKSDVFSKLRDTLHAAPFLEMGEKGARLVRFHKLLDNKFGLPQIFDKRYSGDIDYPHDIKSDARELYNKWCNKDFGTDIVRYIVFGQGMQIEPGHKKSSNYSGHGDLVNGSWWPLIQCMVRDGAHGEFVAGISGEASRGAYSCFMSGGKDHPYQDRDEGDIVHYYGQDSRDPNQIARGTRLMLLSEKNDIPVRFIRSSKANSKYAPELGFRYDGLYKVRSHEIVDEAKQTHLFRLERIPGQGPIRGGNGPESRPTPQEIHAYKQDKRLRSA